MQMKLNEEIFIYFDDDIKNILKNANKLKNIEEIRIFNERHIILYTSNDTYYVSNNAELNKYPKDLYIPSSKSVEKTISLMCNNSIYSEIDNIKTGYLTLPCGHRVGISGETVVKDDEVIYIKSISCINVRITKQIKGFADLIINDVLSNNIVKNTLIISPPQCGKTTLLRNLSYLLGGKEFSKKIGIVDERNEIASLINGKVLNDIGLHSFVMSNCKKSVGINMIIRAMAPDVIITDEIGSEDDVISINNALCSGVKVITSIHAENYSDFIKSNYSKKIKDFFDVFIVLSRKNGPGTIDKIIKTR